MSIDLKCPHPLTHIYYDHCASYKLLHHVGRYTHLNSRPIVQQRQLGEEELLQPEIENLMTRERQWDEKSTGEQNKTRENSVLIQPHAIEPLTSIVTVQGEDASLNEPVSC